MVRIDYLSAPQDRDEKEALRLRVKHERPTYLVYFPQHAPAFQSPDRCAWIGGHGKDP